MDMVITIVIFASLVCAAGACESGNYIVAVVSIIVLAIMTPIANRRYEREQKRRVRKVAR